MLPLVVVDLVVQVLLLVLPHPRTRTLRRRPEGPVGPSEPEIFFMWGGNKVEFGA